MGLPHWILMAVAAQRLLELLWAGVNTRRLFAAGAREIGAGHYPLFILLHGGWLIALFLLTPADAPISWTLVGIFALLQLARLWVIAVLGRYWTTRIISLPEAPLVSSGPYRFVRHPNYLIVALEIPILPLAFDQTAIAVVFAFLNIALLCYRIRIENGALQGRRVMPQPL